MAAQPRFRNDAVAEPDQEPIPDDPQVADGKHPVDETLPH